MIQKNKRQRIVIQSNRFYWKIYIFNKKFVIGVYNRPKFKTKMSNGYK